MCRIFLEEEKSASFLFIRSFRPSNRTSNSLEKNQNSRGEEGLTILEFRGYPGGRTFWNFQGKEGLKCSFWPVVGYGYFLEPPNN